MEQLPNFIYPAPMTGELAKRLAEAADGLRDGKYYFFLSLPEYPYDLVRATGADTLEEARSNADNMLDAWNNQPSVTTKKAIYGPYRTLPEDGYNRLTGYNEIEVNFKSDSGSIHTITLPGNTDTIVLSLEAYDKFILPYYTKLYGLTHAGELRAVAKIKLSTSLDEASLINGTSVHTDGTSTL